MKTAVFTGGGTAGHVLPAVPVMRALQRRGVEVVFIGGADGLERRYLEGLDDVRFFGIASGKLRRYWSWRNLTDVARVLRGVWQSLRLIGRIRPSVVFSKGGHLSFPVVLAARMRGIPIVAHESDFSPGLANRLAMPFLDALCTSFPMRRPGSLRGELVHTGSPVRPELLAGSAARGRKLVQAPAGRPVVLVTGGSLGADALNEVVVEAAPELVRECCLVHVCGPGKRTGPHLPGYRQYEFVGPDWGDMLAAADLVVSRAGSNTLFELLSLGKPNLLIPLPARASRGDQIQNADYAAEAGYSRVIQQEQLDASTLVNAVLGMLSEKDAWAARLARFEALPAVDLMVALIERTSAPSN
ncbi:MAG: UDP-N-acetylglucosamine--N-acetylmuramyl-(pentapeptide) pyrophosphoryl-undecaprenol N-acetylglucosamine transferase [Gammaproteobacteria bacterium]|nr:UDP-N-acetylglucosamine--N-acetylmuramyl-(pentapeptide) pyrophosphoryl-undecaprenol N-acetylglucosamine transferase [Gammaproteobacteria bacterium]MDE0366593.1 UDP-N-acetylglucosamine--N-acetylmuramyl-(pentapeptide) pyrophosphoryl-undecaprenol N-acetylglucosamine transferase [Gammaproteobacteria bacterium]